MERYHDIYLIYKLGFNAAKNPEFHSELWDLKKIYCEDTICEDGNDWNFEKHIEISEKPDDKAYVRLIDNHLSWDIENWIVRQINESYANDAIKFLSDKKMKEFFVSQVFTINKTSASYNKEDLKAPRNDDTVYDYITRTVTNRGICEKTGFIDKYAGLYLETVLNGLSEKLLSGLVRDVDTTFLEMKISLPVNENDEIDFDWMSNFVKSREDAILQNLFTAYQKKSEEG